MPSRHAHAHTHTQMHTHTCTRANAKAGKHTHQARRAQPPLHGPPNNARALTRAIDAQEQRRGSAHKGQQLGTIGQQLQRGIAYGQTAAGMSSNHRRAHGNSGGGQLLSTHSSTKGCPVLVPTVSRTEHMCLSIRLLGCARTLHRHVNLPYTCVSVRKAVLSAFLNQGWVCFLIRVGCVQCRSLVLVGAAGTGIVLNWCPRHW